MAEQLNIYDPRHVSNLFHSMASTYGLVNVITSFGFTAIWRRYSLSQVSMHHIESCCDLMSGMGELIPSIKAKFPLLRTVAALDSCPAMCRKILVNHEWSGGTITVVPQRKMEIRL